MLVICLFFYADLLAYKITPIIDFVFLIELFKSGVFFFSYLNIYCRNTKYRNEFVFQYRAALLSLSGLLTLKREPFVLLHKDLSASFQGKVSHFHLVKVNTRCI